MRNYDSEEFSEFFHSDSKTDSHSGRTSKPSSDRSSRSRESGSRSDRAAGENRQRAKKSTSEEMKMRKKLRSSKKLGMILSFIQFCLSFAFMLLLWFQKEQLPIIIDMPKYFGIGVVLIILWLIPFRMQLKRLFVKRIGKTISVFISIILAITMIAYCKFYLPIVDLGGKEKVSQEPFVVYLSGNDTSGEIVTSSNGRSDTNILAVVNPKTCTALLLTTPRDAYLELIAKDLPTGLYDKLTHAGIYGNGVKDSDGKWGHGCDVSMNMLSKLYNVDVKHYMRVNFTGFARLVNALGGVTLNVTESFSTQAYGRTYTFEKGPQKLDGLAALTFVRERHSFAKGDLQRGANQVAMIKAIATEALSAKTFLNYDEIIGALGNTFETDLSLSSLATLQIALQSKSEYNGWNIVSYAVDGSSGGGYQFCYSENRNLSVVMLNEDSVNIAKQLVQKVMNGDVVTDSTAAELAQASSDNANGNE